MQALDLHTHILPRHIPRFVERFGEGGFMTLEHIKLPEPRVTPLAITIQIGRDSEAHLN